jgi:hypothetical protein
VDKPCAQGRSHRIRRQVQLRRHQAHHEKNRTAVISQTSAAPNTPADRSRTEMINLAIPPQDVTIKTLAGNAKCNPTRPVMADKYGVENPARRGRALWTGVRRHRPLLYRRRSGLHLQRSPRRGGCAPRDPLCRSAVPGESVCGTGTFVSSPRCDRRRRTQGPTHQYPEQTRVIIRNPSRTTAWAWSGNRRRTAALRAVVVL